ncbi:hypothetical protein G7Y89_g7232 [Cudoniella acicularis]|uniref:Uncharacterized protein n=1 Tax=Cudoniella acicularis TaxID=354080 RepID=A0A8H4W255_9HELO|nr:hypothetical protein G7Y89_g7232 [Cudoniella acicularis]
MALAQAPRGSSTQEAVGFPSGSKWGIPQLRKLNFPLQPENHPLEDLHWEYNLSKENAEVLDQLRRGFGLPEEEWLKDNIDPLYEVFYNELASMRPQPRAKEVANTRNPAVRSNTKLPSSSVGEHSSPQSKKSAAPHSAESSALKNNVSSEETPRDHNTTLAQYDKNSPPTPTPKRPRDDFTKSPSLPALPPMIARPSSTTDTAPPAPPDFPELPSSQTDSTFPGSEHDSSSQSEDEQHSQGDRPEINVTILIRILLNQICKVHGSCNGYRFSVTNDVETLVIPTCGDFPRSIPDMLVLMHYGERTYSIVDYEGKRLRMHMTEEEKFAQEVAHLLGRGNLMKSAVTSDNYDVHSCHYLSS